MSLSVPTTQDLADDILAQIEASLEQTIPILPKAFLRVLAKIFAGAVVILYRYAGFIFLQLFVAHATMRETTINGRIVRPLVEWGRLVGIGDPLEAQRAEHALSVTVVSQVGFLAAGSQVVDAATGVIHLTTTDVALNAPTVVVPIRASSDQSGGDGSGSIGNLAPGQSVSFASPTPSIARDAVVIAQTLTGADAETEDAYRARIIRRFQRRPQGGAYADYRDWAEGVAGIVRAWPYTAAAPGQVDVYIEATEASSGSPDGVPTPAQIAAVENAVLYDEDGQPYRRPANAQTNIHAIFRTAFDVDIVGISATNLPAAQAAIEEAIDDYLRAREPFLVGISVLPRRDRVTLAGVSGVADDAVSALGGTIASVQLLLSGIPTPAYTLSPGELAKLGSVTYA